METVIVVFIVAAAVIYTGWKFYRIFSCRETGCSCSGSCPYNIGDKECSQSDRDCDFARSSKKTT